MFEPKKRGKEKEEISIPKEIEKLHAESLKEHEAQIMLKKLKRENHLQKNYFLNVKDTYIKSMEIADGNKLAEEHIKSVLESKNNQFDR